MKPTQERHIALEHYGGALLVAVLALSLYAATAAPWLTWQHAGADGGDLITAAMTFGVPHPSGYPTYCLLARLFALLPLGSIARRFNLFSATLAAITVGVVYLSVYELLAGIERPRWRAPLAMATALLLATGPTLWSQATIAEVYTLHTLVCALCWYQALRLDRTRGWGAWALLGLTIGLGLGVHLTLVLLLPGLAVWLWPLRSKRRIGAMALGAALGLGVYAYLPLAAAGDPPVNWGDPRDWSSFWWVVSGKLYHGYAFGVPWCTFLERLAAWLRLWAQQFAWVGLPLGLLGWGSWLGGRHRRLAVATVLAAVAFGVYAAGYNTTDAYVYLLPMYLCGALWLAEGGRVLLSACANLPAPLGRLATVAGILLLVALPLGSAAYHYRDQDLSQDGEAAQWATETLERLPRRALLITGDDAHSFTANYVQWVEHRRTDVCVVDADLFSWPWYRAELQRRYPELRGLGPETTLAHLIEANLSSSPVYLSTPRTDLGAAVALRPSGGLWLLVPADAP